MFLLFSQIFVRLKAIKESELLYRSDGVNDCQRYNALFLYLIFIFYVIILHCIHKTVQISQQNKD